MGTRLFTDARPSFRQGRIVRTVFRMHRLANFFDINFLPNFIPLGPIRFSTG